MQSPILISLSPNTEKDDILLALKLLFRLGKQPESVGTLEAEMKKYLGINHAVAFNSGRAAWWAILMALGLKEGSEVLIPAFTCNAVVNPILQLGFKPVFVDIDERTLNIDPAELEKRINPSSRVVLAQHTFGLPADLEKISATCQKNNLILIEDCAHSLGATDNGKRLGTFGQAAFFSFGRDKVISSVFGGMSVTNDHELAGKLRQIQASLGEPSRLWTTQQLLHPILTHLLVLPLYRFGDLGKLVLVLLQKTGVLSKAVKNEEKQGLLPAGFAQKMPEALAVLALNQLGKLEKVFGHQQKIASFYWENLKNPVFDLPSETPGRIYLRFSLLLKGGETDKILKEARKRKIFLDDGWRKAVITPPDTRQDKMGYRKGDCPVAERMAEKIINLPTHVNVSLEKARRITDFLNSCHSEYDISCGLPHAMEIKEIEEKEAWESFLLSGSEETFLQSWNWGGLQKSLGNKIWRLGVFENELLALALVTEVSAKRGKFLLVQHGPVLARTSADKSAEALKVLLEKLKVIAAEEKASFIRISPLRERSAENEKIFKDLGFIDSPMHANAYTATWKLSLDKSPPELLSQMRKTTRYLIHQAENNPGISVEKRSDEESLKAYQKLNLETARKQSFTPFSSDFIQKELAALAPDGQAQLFLGKYQGEILAGALVIFWSGKAFYHQAASSRRCSKIPLPYLILWEAIKEAQSRGCRIFDFWGFVDPKIQPHHPWAGPTLFKMGFGGQSHEYLNTKDLPLSKRYWLIHVFEKIRKMIRGL